MKVLWVSNSPIGPAARILGTQYSGSSGGWIQTEYENLECVDIELSFLCTLPSISKKEIKKNRKGNERAYCISAPRLSYGMEPDKYRQAVVQSVIDEVQPDIIQIWGTETWLSKAVAKAETCASKIIFVQGLIGVHQRYMGGYFRNNTVNRQFSHYINPLLLMKSLIRVNRFKKQAQIEKETMILCGNVIIDSDFAKAYCESLSSGIHAYKHVLVPNRVFYEKTWEFSCCEKHSIFTIYGSSSEKGTQNLLWAVSILKKHFDDIKVYIPGPYKLDGEGRLVKTRNDSFQNVLYRMIEELDIKDHIVFPGRLSPVEMAEYMVRCNVFVNTSCMEVHALSLRESMVVGAPCITSLCGSVGEYVRNGENGIIYRFEEYESLAYNLKKIFLDEELAKALSVEARKTFIKAKGNDYTLIDIYRDLIRKSK